MLFRLDGLAIRPTDMKSMNDRQQTDQRSWTPLLILGGLGALVFLLLVVTGLFEEFRSRLSQWSFLDTWIVLTAGLAAMACALPGVFLVLRRQSMMGDALSHTVLPGIGAARYLPSGHVVYAQIGGVLAARFDPARLDPPGPPISILDSVRVDTHWDGSDHGQFAFSHTGSLVYVPGGATVGENELVWVDREGRERIGEAT